MAKLLFERAQFVKSGFPPLGSRRRPIKFQNCKPSLPSLGHFVFAPQPQFGYPTAQGRVGGVFRRNVAVTVLLAELTEFLKMRIPKRLGRGPIEPQQFQQPFLNRFEPVLAMPLIRYPKPELRILRPLPGHIAVAKSLLERDQLLITPVPGL